MVVVVKWVVVELMGPSRCDAKAPASATFRASTSASVGSLVKALKNQWITAQVVPR